MITRSALALAAVILVGGCASSSFDRHFDARRWTDAAAAFANDSSLQTSPRSLYRAAVMYATPGSDVYDPITARSLLERLLATHPTSGHSIDPATLALHSLLVDMEQSRAAVAVREAALRDTLRSVSAEADRLRDEIDLIEAQLGEKRQENESMRLLIDRLAADLRGREAQLTEIRDELARLKAIDLQRPPVRSH